MSGGDGIIHSFQQRRQLEDAIAALAHTNSQAELNQAVQKLAHGYPADVLLPAVVRHLGATSSQLRGGLGLLCTLLPRDEAVNALRSAVGNRQKSAQERTTAALILDRFLHQPAPAALLADLAGAEEAPYQSLVEAVTEAGGNRHVLLEYVTQMQEHPVDTAFMVMRLIDRLPPGDQVELLRLIAQDARPQVAHAALERLASVAGGPDAAAGETALRALHTLAWALPADPATVAERSLRKFQFSGRRYHAPSPEGWRSLLGPTDASGYFSVWFVREPGERDGDGAWLGFVLSIHGGMLQFSGTEGMARSFLPASQPIGKLVTVRTSGEQQTVLLEAPFDVGRWLVRKGLEAGWQRNGNGGGSGSGASASSEMSEHEYQLYNDLLWQFDPPRLPPDLLTWWEQTAGQPDRADKPIDATALATAAAVLVSDPAMEGWVRWTRAMWNTVQLRSQFPNGMPVPTVVALLLRELARMPDHRSLLQGMAAGLRVQTLWYAVAGSPADAERAALLARAGLQLPITENPLLAGLLEAGLKSD